MQQAICRSSLVPAGFVVESAFYDSGKAIITVVPPARLVFVHLAVPFHGGCIAATSAA
jgi:hypothetical protein